jgi:hypothetical protein
MVNNARAGAAPHDPSGPGLAGLALGLRQPGQGALAGHVAGCATCAARLQELVAVADGLSLLAPAADPPSGFEERVLEAARARALCRLR